MQKSLLKENLQEPLNKTKSEELAQRLVDKRETMRQEKQLLLDEVKEKVVVSSSICHCKL